MCKEIGGYIELDTYRGKMLYDNAVLLNCGRNALLYLINVHNIRNMYVPRFMCNSNDEVLKSENVNYIYYSIDEHFKPRISDRKSDEWLYLVNYYGQFSNEYIKSLGNNIIVDNAQAYFQPPILGYDTIYACRKFFGVPDGAILYTDTVLNDIPVDVSYNRMNFLLGRYERTAGEFYSEYVDNNERFRDEPMKQMSKLTKNLLHAIDYAFVKDRRTQNFKYLYEQFEGINRLELVIPEGAFMYPLYVYNGDEIRKRLQQQKIYIPILWPDVFSLCEKDELEYDMAMNILPLPVDQRYGTEEMEYIVAEIMKYLR